MQHKTPGGTLCFLYYSRVVGGDLRSLWSPHYSENIMFCSECNVLSNKPPSIRWYNQILLIKKELLRGYERVPVWSWCLCVREETTSTQFFLQLHFVRKLICESQSHLVRYWCCHDCRLCRCRIWVFLAMMFRGCYRCYCSWCDGL